MFTKGLGKNKKKVQLNLQEQVFLKRHPKIPWKHGNHQETKTNQEQNKMNITAIIIKIVMYSPSNHRHQMQCTVL